MYSPIKLIVRHFISHTDSTFVFKKDALTLIFGKNEDDKEEGANSNGSGKSVIIEGITYALTGETYRDILKDDVIQEGEKEAYVYFELYNSYLKETLVIERWIKKSSSICKVFINTVEQKQLTGVPEANKFILEKIGISKDDLLNYFVINQDNSSSFFTNNDTKQKEIIGRFIDTSVVEVAIKKLETERDVLLKEKQTYERLISTINFGIDEYEGLIQEETEVVETSTEELTIKIDQEITENEKEIVWKQDIVEACEKSIKKLNKEQEELQLEIDNFSTFKELEKQIKIELKTNKDSQINLNHEKNKLELKLKEAISCPKCKHEFILKHEHENLDDIKEAIKTIDVDLLCNFEAEATLTDESSLIDKELEKLEVLTDKHDKNGFSIADHNRKKKTNIKEIEDLQTRNKNLKKKKEVILNEEKSESKIPLYEEKKSNLQEQFLKTEAQKLIIEQQIEEKDYQLFHLGKKGFLTYLANESIKTIETYCNTFLNKMNTNLNVCINGYKLLASGEVRDKIEVFIVKNGITKGKFGKYSGGQKERVKLASILTFFSLINNGLNGKGLDLLCLDESLDHLDELGQKKCLELLKLFNITTLVITHGHAETMLDGYNKVVVKYKNKESSIV